MKPGSSVLLGRASVIHRTLTASTAEVKLLQQTTDQLLSRAATLLSSHWKQELLFWFLKPAN